MGFLRYPNSIRLSPPHPIPAHIISPGQTIGMRAATSPFGHILLRDPKLDIETTSTTVVNVLSVRGYQKRDLFSRVVAWHHPSSFYQPSVSYFFCSIFQTRLGVLLHSCNNILSAGA